MIFKRVIIWCIATVSLCMAKGTPYSVDTIEGKYPYGIRIHAQSFNINIPDEEHETITIYQNRKLIDRIKTYRDDPLGYTDLDGDGYKEVVFNLFDGERGFDLVIATIKPKMQKPLVFKGVKGDIVHIDGKPKLLTWESYGAIYSAEYAFVTIYADFNGTDLHLDKSLQKEELSKLQQPQQKADVFLQENGFLGTHSPKALIKIIAYAAQAWYAGESNQAIALLRRTVHPTDKATMYLFLQDFVEGLSWSRFWDDIREFNNWQEEDGEMVGGVIVLRYKNMDKDAITRVLFEQMYKKQGTASMDKSLSQ